MGVGWVSHPGQAPLAFVPSTAQRRHSGVETCVRRTVFGSAATGHRAGCDGCRRTARVGLLSPPPPAANGPGRRSGVVWDGLPQSEELPESETLPSETLPGTETCLLGHLLSLQPFPRPRTCSPRLVRVSMRPTVGFHLHRLQ
ncbi:hypothetical protein COCON_G00041760 [Conger conger]|uniref:Uncharacterized protein n=1 Tax=Conger conger TaxID=82655 RepID=A0A9Q1DTQ0_CONCO|nr:hypothetical protein COCON_G00041760 [Conger conger]